MSYIGSPEVEVEVQSELTWPREVSQEDIVFLISFVGPGSLASDTYVSDG